MKDRAVLALGVSLSLVCSATAQGGGGIGGWLGQAGGKASSTAKSVAGKASNTVKSAGGSISSGFKSGVSTVSGGVQHAGSMVNVAGKRLGTSVPGKISVPGASVKGLVKGAKNAGGQVSSVTHRVGGVVSGEAHRIGGVASGIAHHEAPLIKQGAVHAEKGVGGSYGKASNYFSTGHGPKHNDNTNDDPYSDPGTGGSSGGTTGGSGGGGPKGGGQYPYHGNDSSPNTGADNGGSDPSGSSSGDDGVMPPAQVAGAFLTSGQSASTIHSSDLGQVVHRSTSALRRTRQSGPQESDSAQFHLDRANEALNTPSLRTVVTKKNATHSPAGRSSLSELRAKASAEEARWHKNSQNADSTQEQPSNSR
jgi:hypothetical protein